MLIMSIIYEVTDQRDVSRIEPLWLKLIEHHKEHSLYFKARYEHASFDTRKKALLTKSEAHPLHVQLAVQKNNLVGYCVSSVTAEGEGEIDSILVAERYRGQYIGDYFIREALLWMDNLQARRKIVSVAGGNEDVFGFYRRYDFFPTAIEMAQAEGEKIISVDTTLPPELRISEGAAADLDLVQPLWEKLSRFEGNMSPRLKEYFYHRPFSKKKADILKITASGALKIDLARPRESDQVVAYCISTVSQTKIGSIESIYLEPDYRKQGLGRILFQRSLDWMENLGIEKRQLWVVYENEPAIRFYQLFGFHTLSTTLMQFKSMPGQE
jgi:ribosomal protein S18 acetylase RimI-like enzyme